nr:MAG TPA: hypothetical protein [Caudoviricetes sp.]
MKCRHNHIVVISRLYALNSLHRKPDSIPCGI